MPVPAMTNRKAKVERQAAQGDTPFLADGAGAGLFIAAYSEALKIWRRRGHAILANLPGLGAPLAPGPAAARQDARARLEDYGKALIALADALDNAIDSDRPGDVAILDLTKLQAAVDAYGRVDAAYQAVAGLCRGRAAPDGLADAVPWGSA